MHCHSQVKRSNCFRLKCPGTIVIGIGNFPDILPPIDDTNGPGPFLSPRLELRLDTFLLLNKSEIVSAGFPSRTYKLAPRWSIAEPEGIYATPPRPLREPRLASFPPPTSSAEIQRVAYVEKREAPSRSRHPASRKVHSVFTFSRIIDYAKKDPVVTFFLFSRCIRTRCLNDEFLDIFFFIHGYALLKMTPASQPARRAIAIAIAPSNAR